MDKLYANSEDPDQTPHSAASDLGLHCLPITLLGVSRQQWQIRLKVLKSSGPEVIICFSCSPQLSMKFSLLIIMKMPTIVGIFIFLNRDKFHAPL